jgi:RNA polymerase II subunit A small phosphatase-like protein
LLDKLDPYKIMPHRLFREACVQYNGSYVKDLRRLGRNIKDVIIVDNSPVSFSLQPENAIPIKSWFDDSSDREL